MSDTFLPGDILINDISLYSTNGIYNMRYAMVKVEIYESIFTENVVGSVTVIDSTNVLNQLNITGDEYINIDFGVPGLPTLNYKLFVESVTLDAFVGSEKTKQLTFNLVGREAIADKSVYIQKAYNTDIGSIVSDIHSTFLGSVSPLEVEGTQGQQNIMVPNYKPFEAINMVRQRATSSSNPSSTYVYFENADGHHFVTIEGMMKGAVVKSFVHVDALATSIYNNTLNNIIDYEVPKFFSAIDKVDFGGLTQRTATYDVRTRKYDTKDQKLGAAGNLMDNFGGGFNVFSFLPFDSASRGDTGLPQSTPLQMDYLSKLMQSYAVFHVYGDTNVQAGKVIYAAIPESVTTDIRQDDPLLSRNYLVSRIARHIGSLNDRPRYTEVIEAIPVPK